MTKTTAKVIACHDVTPDLRILHIQPETSFPYKAGQYLNLSVHGGEERPYSIANAPQDNGIIELHIRQSGELSTYLCKSVMTGEDINIEGAHGTCTYRSQCKKPLLALAGGTGLAQIKPLVEKALSTNRDTPVYLYHGAKAHNDLYLDNHFKALAEKDTRLIYRPILSEETTTQDTVKYGFLNEHIEHDFDDLKGFRSYLSGNPEMIASLKQVLLAKNIDPNRIHSDI